MSQSGFDVPEAAAVWADFVGHHEALEVALEHAADFDFEVDELDPDAKQHAGHEVVYAERKCDHVVQVLLGGPRSSSL